MDFSCHCSEYKLINVTAIEKKMLVAFSFLFLFFFWKKNNVAF